MRRRFETGPGRVPTGSGGSGAGLDWAPHPETSPNSHPDALWG